MRLINRVEALENRSGVNLRPWHRILVDVGQSVEDAVAAHEAAHGSVAGDNLVLRQFVRGPAPARSC